ncbi:MAG: PilN domain-containing protein [Candidatus Omnitrophica bacterium]|nr:PilN domain-containing protein [Candidatus Omnitrophota bacterium]
MNRFFGPNILALELTDGHLRWACLKGLPGQTRLTAGQVDTPGKNALEIKAALPAGAARVILIVDRSEILTKNLRLPSTRPEELDRILAFTLPQEIPYEVSEIVYQFSSMPHKIEGFSEVQVSWMLKKNVEEKLRFLNNLGISADEVLTSSESLLNYYLKLRAVQPSLPGHAVLLSLEESQFEIAAIDGAKTFFSKSVKRGLTCLRSEPDTFRRELEAAVESCRKESGAATGTLYLASPWKSRHDAAKAIASLTGLSVLPLPEVPDLCRLDGPSVDAKIAGAFYPSGTARGLMPSEFRNVRTSEKQVRSQKQSLIFLSVFMVFSLGFLTLSLLTQNLRSGRINREFGQMNQKSRSVVKMADELALLAELSAQKAVPLALLSALPGIVPQEITLNQIEYNREEGFKIRGLGKSNQSISTLLKSLKGLPLIRAASFDYSKRRVQEGQEYYEFQISAKIAEKRKTP